MKGAVIFAFGVAGPSRPALPGPTLVAMMRALGFSDASTRGAILRMRRDGRLASRRRGPVVEYTLTPASVALSAAVLAPVMGDPPPWDGAFRALFVSVPERDRAYRDTLRRAAALAGFGLLQPGVFITPDERRWSRLEATIEAAPTGSRLIRGTLRVEPDIARVVARAAWQLPDLAARYLAHADELRGAAGRDANHQPIGPESVRRLWEVMAPIFSTAAEDPGLPADLLPEDWPAARVRQAVIAALTTLAAPAWAYLDSLLASDGRG